MQQTCMHEFYIDENRGGEFNIFI